MALALLALGLGLGLGVGRVGLSLQAFDSKAEVGDRYAEGHGRLGLGLQYAVGVMVMLRVMVG